MVVLIDSPKAGPPPDERDLEAVEEAQRPVVDIPKTKCDHHHRLSRRRRLWVHLATTFFVVLLIRLYLLLKTNEKDLELLTSLLDMEQEQQARPHYLHAVDVMLDPKKSEDLFLYVHLMNHLLHDALKPNLGQFRARRVHCRPLASMQRTPILLARRKILTMQKSFSNSFKLSSVSRSPTQSQYFPLDRMSRVTQPSIFQT